MKAITFVLSIFLLLVSDMAVGSDNVYNMVKPDKENARVRELVSKMTLEEKCDYIGAVTSFVMRSVDRLGIPQIRMADGPQGIRNNTVSTLLPAGNPPRRYMEQGFGRKTRSWSGQRRQGQGSGHTARTGREHLPGSDERQEFRIFRRGPVSGL